MLVDNKSYYNKDLEPNFKADGTSETKDNDVGTNGAVDNGNKNTVGTKDGTKDNESGNVDKNKEYYEMKSNDLVENYEFKLYEIFKKGLRVHLDEFQQGEKDNEELLRLMEALKEKDDKEEELQRLRENLKEKDDEKEELLRLREALKEKDDESEELLRLREAFKEKDDENEELLRLREVLNDEKEELLRLREALKEKDDENEELLRLREAFKEKDDEKEELLRLREVLKEKDDEKEELLRLKEALKEKDNEKEELLRLREVLNEVLKEKDNEKEELLRLREVLKEKDNEKEELLRLREVLKEKDHENEELLRLREVLKEKDNENEELLRLREVLNEVLKEKDNENEELLRLREVLKEKDHENEELLRLREVLKEKDEKINGYKLKISEKKKKIEELNHENGDLQNYIGKATSFSLGDSDSNHSVQLVKDIENLQMMLESYVGILRPKVDVNFEQVNELLRDYGCKAQVSSLKGNEIQLVKSVLQRYALKEIFRYVKLYFYEGKIECLEGEICETTKSLLDLLEEISTTYGATNDIIKAYPIKIRQQIYGFLGSLGFNENNENKQEHDFIKIVTERLNASMNNLRKINNPQKKKSHDDTAANLIREAVRIFCFRLRVQEPVPESRWLKYNHKINPDLVVDRYESYDDANEDDANEDNEYEDNEYSNELIELCFFPLIVSNYKTKDQKIYARAKIVQQF